jgi:uncharacterized membrane protein
VEPRAPAAARRSAVEIEVDAREQNRAQNSEAPARWGALDTFRGLAVLSMIQGHTFTALTEPAAFSGRWVPFYTLLHGLTAPMFLFGGGLSYGLVSRRRRGARVAAAVAARARPLDARIVRRGLALLALGYALQWPERGLGSLIGRPELLRAVFAVGPLQLVGACLIACEVLASPFCSRADVGAPSGTARMTLATASLAASIALFAPYVWRAEYSARLWPLVGMWLDGHGGSLFPCFPWAAFFFLGVLGSELAVPMQRTPKRSGLLCLLAGSCGAGALYLAWRAGERLTSLYGSHDFWHTNPMYLGFRAALVVALWGLVLLLEPLWLRLRRLSPFCSRAGPRASTAAQRAFDALARQSLVAYVAHLLLLYGSPVTTGLACLGRVFDLRESAAIFVCVALHTLAISYLWEHLRPMRWLARQASRLGRGEALAALVLLARGAARVDASTSERARETRIDVR